MRDSKEIGPEYIFDNADAQTPARFKVLSALYDPGSIEHLSKLGVSEGWRCLEIGAGPGSMASWLSHRVGLSGQVVATDIDTRFLEQMQRPNLKVLRHDLRTEPVPEGEFDLIHSRLVLMHLPEREKVLSSLVNALKPGGWLLMEEFDALSLHPDPEVSPFEAALKTNLAMRHIMRQQGLDLRYGRLLVGQLRRLGLVDLSAEGRTSMWQGGSLGADLMRANFLQLQEMVIASELVTQGEFEQDLARLNEPDFLMPSPVLWAVQGRQPHLPGGNLKSRKLM